MHWLRSVKSAPEMRVGFFYFVLMIGPGLAGPYLPIWMNHIGLSNPQIGLTLSLPQYVMIVIGILVGRLADKAADWRNAIIVYSWLSVVAMLGLLLQQRYWAVCVAWAASASFSMALNSVLDAASLRMTRRRGSEFAWLRGTGSLAFVFSVLASGMFVDRFGIDNFAIGLIGLTLVRTVFSHLLPPFRDPTQTFAPSAPQPVRRRLLHLIHFDVVDMVGSGLQLSRRRFLGTLIAVACINGSHAFLTLFASLHWAANGLSNTAIGVLWSVSTTAEIILMLLFRRISGRVNSFILLIIAGFAATFRWCMTAVFVDFWVLFFCQTLHCLSFAAVYLGTMNFVANWTRERNAAEAMGVVAMLSAGMMATMSLVAGQVSASLGGYSFFIAAGLTGGATLAIGWIHHRSSADRTPAPQMHDCSAT